MTVLEILGPMFVGIAWNLLLALAVSAYPAVLWGIAYCGYRCLQILNREFPS